MSILEQSAKSRDQLSAPTSDATKGPKDTHSLIGPSHQAHIEMEEVTTPIKLKPISMAPDGVYSQSQAHDECKQLKGKGRWKKIAREKGQNKDEEMLAHDTATRVKRLIKFEALVEVEARPPKRFCEAQLSGDANFFNETVAAAG